MIREVNCPKGGSSKYLKECLEKNYPRIVSENLYVEVKYFQRGIDAFKWRGERIVKEQGIRGIFAVPVKNPSLLQMVEWTCRWIDGSFTVAIVEDNLREVTQGDIKAIEGVSFHILGHIEDMDKRDYLTSFREWLPEVRTLEEWEIKETASNINLEYTAEKIAIEKGRPPLLVEFRRKVALRELKRMPKEVKRLTKKEIEEIKVPSKKEFLLSRNISPFAARLAWMKSDYRKLYLEKVDSLTQQLEEIFSKNPLFSRGIGEKVIHTGKRYTKELEEMLLKEDLSDFKKVEQKLQQFIS